MWDSKKVMLTTITKSCKIINDRVFVRLPIRSRLLDEILFELERCFGGPQPQPYLEKLYKAAFSIAYYGLMHVGELTTGSHTVKAKDVHVGWNKDKILLVLHSSKTHGKESHSQKIKIQAIDQELLRKKLFCHFQLALDYMCMRGIYEHEGKPFFIFADRSPVNPTHFRNVLKKQLNRLNLDSSLYNCHSLRIGRATDMADFGYSFSEIQQKGRWKSSAMFCYLKG